MRRPRSTACLYISRGILTTGLSAGMRGQSCCPSTGFSVSSRTLQPNNPTPGSASEHPIGAIEQQDYRGLKAIWLKPADGPSIFHRQFLMDLELLWPLERDKETLHRPILRWFSSTVALTRDQVESTNSLSWMELNACYNPSTEYSVKEG